MTTVQTGISKHRIRNVMLTLALFCMLLFAVGGMFAHQAQATTIHGYLKDASRQPISGSYISVYSIYQDDDGSSDLDWVAGGSTDESGYYNFDYDMLDDVVVIFEASDLNYVSGYYLKDNPDLPNTTRTLGDATIFNDQTGNMSYDLGDAVLQKGNIIEGKITDSAGNSIEGIYARIVAADNDGYLGSSYGRSDSDGNYKISGIPAGNCRVAFCDWTGVYLPQFNGGAFTLKSAPEISLGAQAATTVNASMKLGGIISGTVEDTNGMPISGADVGVSNTSNVEWDKWDTSATGYYQITGLIDGNYCVNFYADGFDDQYYNGVDDLSKATLVPIKNASTAENINARLARQGTISGIVRDASGNALSGVSVILYDMESNGDSAHSVQSGSDGRFKLDGLSAGNYRIGFEDRSQNEYCLAYYSATATDKAVTDFSAGDTITLEVGGNLSLDDVLLSQKKGTVTGNVTNAEGISLEGIEVSLYSVDGNGDSSHGVTTDALGNYTLDNVAPGTYKVGFHDFSRRIYASSYYNNANILDDATVITVTPGNVCTDINGQLKGRCSISGRVMDINNQPIEGICVGYEPEHYDSGASNHWVLTNANGEYTIPNVDSGKTKVSFSDWVAAGNPGKYARLDGFYGRQYNEGKYSEEAADSFTLSPGDNKTNVNATLAGRHSVSGVLRNIDGTPAAGVEVGLENYGYDGDGSYQKTTTDADGVYKFGGLDNEEYCLEAGSSISGEWYRWFDMEGADLTLNGVIADDGGSYAIGDFFERTFSSDNQNVTVKVNSAVAHEIDSLSFWFGAWHNEQGENSLNLDFYPGVEVADGDSHGCFDLKNGYIEADLELPQGINALDGTLYIAAQKASYDSWSMEPMAKCNVGNPSGAYSYAVLNTTGTKIRVYAKSAGYVEITSKQSLRVDFDTQGGSLIASTYVDENGLLTQLTPPTRSGYTFGGWYKEASCSNAWNFSTDKVTQDTTLFAKWTLQSLKVSFNSQNGSAVASAYVAENGLVAQPAVPTRSGYTFGGWFKEAACSNAWNFSTDKVTQDTTLYAKWTPVPPAPTVTPVQLSGANYLTSMYKSTGTWSRAWSKTRMSNTLTLKRSKSSVKLKARISSQAKVYFKYAGHSYSNVTGKTKTIKVSRGHKKTIYFKVVSQSGKSRTYKIVVKRRS